MEMKLPLGEPWKFFCPNSTWRGRIFSLPPNYVSSKCFYVVLHLMQAFMMIYLGKKWKKDWSLLIKAPLIFCIYSKQQILPISGQTNFFYITYSVSFLTNPCCKKYWLNSLLSSSIQWKCWPSKIPGSPDLERSGNHIPGPFLDSLAWDIWCG